MSPLLSAAGALRLAARLRLPLPETLLARLACGGEKAGWAFFAATLTGLRTSGLADGVAVMTQEMDGSAEFAERIRRALRSSAAIDPA